MNILDLPPEIFNKILVFSILARSLVEFWGFGVTRAFRLKLISKAFYHAFQPSLFESRVLDMFSSRDSLRHWPVRRHYGGDQFWHSYLVYRVHNETDPTIGRFVEIRRIARELHVVADADYDETVGGLCWLALELGTKSPGKREAWVEHGGRSNDPPQPRLNLLSAVAYFGYLDFAKELLAEGCCPTQDDLFPSPMQLAAFAGNTDMVVLFQEKLLETEDGKANIGLGSVEGAALRGDMDMLRLAIYPPSRPRPHSSDFNDQKCGNVDHSSDAGHTLRKARYVTKSWDVFQYITSFFDSSGPFDYSFLSRHAEWGNMEMVQHLLDAGWDVNGENRLNNDPLIIAARSFHEDIVELLLKRGANPNIQWRSQLGSALAAAAAAGSMRIVRKLIEYGANIYEDDATQMKMLRKALLQEHTEMVNFFFDQNLLNRKCPEDIRKHIETEELESMIDLLKKWN
ncbi:ankyrin repeat-containing domain protein [Xylaria arbuscula]|nr:ankyrin repeat-containing domain protein [Xylaria arbuscula]